MGRLRGRCSHVAIWRADAKETRRGCATIAPQLDKMTEWAEALESSQF